MVDAVPGTSQENTLLHIHRARRRSWLNAKEGLNQHHSFGPAAANILTASFPAAMRAAPIVLEAEVAITGASPSGLIFEMGSSTNGLALYVDSDRISMAAGGSGDNGVVADWINPTGAATDLANGVKFHIIAGVHPGLGKAQVHVVGYAGKVAHTTAVNGALPSNSWADTGAGSVFSAVNGTTTSKATLTTAPSNFVLVGHVGVFPKQYPRFFSKVV